MGCLTRVLSNLTQALFALNERYFLRDEGVMDVITTFPELPPGYIRQVNYLLSNPGITAQELIKTVTELERVWYSLTSLPAVQYQPKFQI